MLPAGLQLPLLPPAATELPRGHRCSFILRCLISLSLPLLAPPRGRGNMGVPTSNSTAGGSPGGWIRPVCLDWTCQPSRPPVAGAQDYLELLLPTQSHGDKVFECLMLSWCSSTFHILGWGERASPEFPFLLPSPSLFPKPSDVFKFYFNLCSFWSKRNDFVFFQFFLS